MGPQQATGTSSPATRALLSTQQQHSQQQAQQQTTQQTTQQGGEGAHVTHKDVLGVGQNHSNMVGSLGLSRLSALLAVTAEHGGSGIPTATATATEANSSTTPASGALSPNSAAVAVQQLAAQAGSTKADSHGKVVQVQAASS